MAATLKSIDYNVAMTFILNNNNNNNNITIIIIIITKRLTLEDLSYLRSLDGAIKRKSVGSALS